MNMRMSIFWDYLFLIIFRRIYLLIIIWWNFIFINFSNYVIFIILLRKVNRFTFNHIIFCIYICIINIKCIKICCINGISSINNVFIVKIIIISLWLYFRFVISIIILLIWITYFRSWFKIFINFWFCCWNIIILTCIFSLYWYYCCIISITTITFPFF